MPYVQRKATYRLYPNATQLGLLREWLGLHCRVYNALLDEHKRRHGAGEKTFNFTAMCRALTEWRGYADALRVLNAQSLQVTAKRAALAFDAFFRRFAAGETAGYPRFKSFSRYPGWGYKTYGDGWRLRSTMSAKGAGYNALSITGIGDIGMRGKARFIGTPATCELMHKAGKWYVSVTFNVQEHQIARPCGRETVAFDWGVDTLLTIARSDGSIEEIDNPRWLKSRLEALRDLGRVISAEERKCKQQMGLDADAPLQEGQRLKKSNRLRRLYAQLSALHSKIARQRKDFYHKLTTWLVETFGLIGTEELAVAKMTRRPEKKVDEVTGEALPNGAAAKAGLNRSILDAAPSMLLRMLGAKAEEAGSWLVKANTRKLKPTQRCHQCGALVPKDLGERIHECRCGCRCGRDENAAKTILRWMLEGEYWVGTIQVGLLQETPSIAAQAA